MTRTKAEAVAVQLHETARFRGYAIDAVAVLSNHVHLVFSAPGEPDPERALAGWKAYASRALNRLTKSAVDAAPWWADGGSKRRLLDEDSRPHAVRYVRDQAAPLVVWLSDEAQRLAEVDG